MKKLIIIITTFILFCGCSATRKISKSTSDVKVSKDIDSQSKVEVKSSLTNVGKTSTSESSTVEEINIKQAPSIELTANFRVDSTAFLRGDTALKLVDITNKNVSVTIYQNGKTKELTAKIRSNGNVQDVPFSEINIKKSTSTKESTIDTSKVITKDSIAQVSVKDKSKLEASESVVTKEIDRMNYYWLLLAFASAILFVYFYRNK